MINKFNLKDNIVEMTILEMSELMDKGEITSVDLVKAYLERIVQYDKNGPKLNSILEINPDALFMKGFLRKDHRCSIMNLKME